jgi:protein disulfide-isomerase
MAFGIQGFPIILANATTKEGKVNFEGIGVPVM